VISCHIKNQMEENGFVQKAKERLKIDLRKKNQKEKRERERG
jgi:hypothetical protein